MTLSGESRFRSCSPVSTTPMGKSRNGIAPRLPSIAPCCQNQNATAPPASQKLVRLGGTWREIPGLSPASGRSTKFGWW